MAIVPAVIVETGQAVNIDIPVVRAPELTAFPDLQDDDLVVGFDTSENATRKMTLAMLRSKMIGDGSTQPPILTNGTIQLVVDAVHAGTMRWDMPSIAGQDFRLERRSLGSMIEPEYEIISTGGFLLVGDSAKMVEGEIFVLTLISLDGGDNPIVDNSGGLFTGIVTIDNAATYSDAHKRKVLNLSGGSNQVVYTLPDVTAVDKNQIIPFESHGTNTIQPVIQTVSGQLIYINGMAVASQSMGFGEVLWLQAGEDGWYVVAMHGYFLSVGEVRFGYRPGLNDIPLNGQLLDRSAYQRLFLTISGFGASIVSETDWNSDPSFQGFFTLGPTTGPDANKKFRLPNVAGAFPRFTDVSGLRDPDTGSRTGGTNEGSSQLDMYKSHTHWTRLNANSQDYVDGGAAPNNIGQDYSHGTPIVTEASGGLETRPKNIYLTGYIKA